MESAEDIDEIWRSVQHIGDVSGNEMWSLCVEQVDKFTWSAYAIKPGQCLGRREAESVREAVTKLAHDLRRAGMTASKQSERETSSTPKENLAGKSASTEKEKG